MLWHDGVMQDKQGLYKLFSGEGHEWGEKPTKLKGVVVKQVIDMLDMLQVKIKHKDEILDDVYEALKILKDKIKMSEDREEIKRIIEMIEDI